MNNNWQYTINTMEFNLIIEMLTTHALSEKAKDALSKLTPYMDEGICMDKMAETTSARRILDACGSPPLPNMNGVDETLILCAAGSMLAPEQLGAVANFAASCKRMQLYLKKAVDIHPEPGVALYGESIHDLSLLYEEIDRCITGAQVESSASPALKAVRRKMELMRSQVKDKLNQLLNSKKQYLSDHYIVQRAGHYVLPVKKEFRKLFGGTVVEMSSTGSTLFIEPDSVVKLQNSVAELEIEEDSEIRKILYALSGLVMDYMPVIKLNIEAMEALDIVFAKAKLSAQMNAAPVAIGLERTIKIVDGRHPLLDQRECVPLNFEVGGRIRGVIITGPNTGGKTVAVKTVGLLSIMAQSGLHIPCGEGSYIGMHDGYYCDIGDSQSISENLSTFSGHMTNIIRILEHAGKDSLVLLDELGSGTDPAEGMGIAVAVLEELKAIGCLFLVTTHYPQVKSYARNEDRVVSARMAFDRESLSPLYRLEMGKTGESCALYIAKRLGLPERVLQRAYDEAYREREPEDWDMAHSDKEDAVNLEPPDKKEVEAPVLPESSRLKKRRETPAEKGIAFHVGDSVVLTPGRDLGIVYKPADKHGNVTVQVKGKKISISHKRLRLAVPAEELYPDKENYDMSIVFDTAKNRKARKKMTKRHDPGLVVTHEE